MDEILKRLYYDARTGFASAHELWARVRRKKPKIKFTDVKAWLQKQPTHSMHKQARKTYSRNRVLVSGIDEQWQADIIDMQALSKFNDKFKYLLNCIDIFSKYAWSIPLKTKNAHDVLEAFRKILDSSGRKPQKLQTDAGTEFTNRDFQKFLKSQFIDFFTTRSEMKASVIERFNRTIKTRMWRYFSKNNTYKYIDVIDALMENYNSSFHRTIGMPPKSVTHANEQEILNKVFRVNKSTDIAFKFNIGDKVRISKVKRHFEKGYMPNWTEEFFIIAERFARHPPVYAIKDQLSEKLEGVFYEHELQKIDVSATDLFIVEKILKTRKSNGKTDYLVRWRGYDQKFDSWVNDLIKL